MPTTATHLNRFTESVIREMTRISNQHNALNLAQGFPDFDPPAALIQAAKDALDAGFHQYAVTWGAPQFRKALARKQTRFMGLEIDPNAHITTTVGSTEAMMTAISAVCNPGEKVIVFDPYYESYEADTILTHAQPVYVRLHTPDFRFDPNELRAAFKQGVKAIVLCNPGNPTGRVHTREELTTIAELAQEFDTFVITDEVYEHIVYEPHQHIYMASLPGMFERTLSCSSLSKTYAITGWRLGYVIAPERVTNSVRKVHDFLTVGAAHPLQVAAATALDFPDSYYAQMQVEYTHRRDLFLPYLDQLGVRYYKPEGAYYVLIDISEFGFASDTEFVIWMIKNIGLAAVPGSSFFIDRRQDLIRLNFAKRDKTIIEAGEKLLRLKEKI